MCFIHRMHLQIILRMEEAVALLFAVKLKRRSTYHYNSKMRENLNAMRKAHRCYNRNFLGF